MIRGLARTYDVQTARWAVKTLEYPVTDVRLTGSGWPWKATLTFILLMLLGALIAFTAVAAGTALKKRGLGKPAAPAS